MKTSITRAEYHQLVGLCALAERCNAQMGELGGAARELLGVSPEPEIGSADSQADGWIDDMFFDRRPSVDRLLSKLQITVQADAPAGAAVER